MMACRTAILRHPGDDPGRGLTGANLGPPDPALLKAQHRAYRERLRAMGVDVIVLEALAGHPDSYFPEDVAVVTDETAVMTRPGALQRRGEVSSVESVLEQYRPTGRIRNPGTLDGGDVLIVDRHCVIGLSRRTNRSGAEQLAGLLDVHGYEVDLVSIPESLHLKSSVNYLDARTLLVTRPCRDLDCFRRYRKLVVPDGDEYAANVVEINGKILFPEGFGRTREMLEGAGFPTVCLDVSEIRKMDGGLTCLSLRLS